jgi:hypothetical protein
MEIYAIGERVIYLAVYELDVILGIFTFPVGAEGVVVDAHQAQNGEMCYFVRFEPGAPAAFCAGSRLEPAATGAAATA